MNVYRIYYEPVEPIKSKSLIHGTLEAATIYNVEGIWHGKSEPTQVVEVIGDANAGVAVVKLAEKLKKANDQEAVLVTECPINSVLV